MKIGSELGCSGCEAKGEEEKFREGGRGGCERGRREGEERSRRE